MGREIYTRISVFVCVLLGLAAAGGIRLSGQTTALEVERFKAEAGVHKTHAQPESAFQLSDWNELSPEPESVSPPPPTRSSFMATWKRVSGAKGYMPPLRQASQQLLQICQQAITQRLCVGQTTLQELPWWKCTI